MQNIFSKYVLNKICLNGHNLKNIIRYRLFLLVLACFILSLSRPVMDEKNILNKQEITPVVIALDVSKSMYLKDIYPSRLSFAKNKIKRLVEKSINISIGIVLFDKNAYMAYPITEDTSAVSYMLKHLSEKQKFEANSNIFSALEASQYMLKKHKSKNVILFSDGANSNDITLELKYLQDNNIKVYAIGVATTDTGLIHNLNHHALKKLAIKSGGSYENFSWRDNDIDSILKQLKKDSIKEKKHEYKLKQYNELFSYPLAFGLFILFFIFNSFFKIKQKNQIILYLLVLSFSLPNTKLQAGTLDFLTLHEAKKMYQDEKYLDSIKLYKTVAKNHQGYYNLANALYKANSYEKAIVIYKKSLSKDKDMNAKVLHNIANCYVKTNELELAKKYYEKALKDIQNPLTKENLALVNKSLIKKKKTKKKSKKNQKTRKKQKKCKTKNKQNSSELKGVSIGEIEFEDSPSSNYEIEIKNLVLSEEERWIKLLEKKQAPILLHKIKTKRSSKNVEQAW